MTSISPVARYDLARAAALGIGADATSATGTNDAVD